MCIDEFCGIIENPDHHQPPKHSTMTKHQSWENRNDIGTRNKIKTKNRILLVGIIVSGIIVIASIALVSIGLVRSKNYSRNNDNNNNNNYNNSIKNDNKISLQFGNDAESLNIYYNNDNKSDGIIYEEIISTVKNEKDGEIENDIHNGNSGSSADINDYNDEMIDDNSPIDEQNEEEEEEYTTSYSNAVEFEKAKKDIDFSLYFCPDPGDGPLSIDLPTFTFEAISTGVGVGGAYHKILLANSSPNVLCTLLEVLIDPDINNGSDLQLKPIGRSYNGQGWEPYHSHYFGTNSVPLSCSDQSNNSEGDCLIVLPPLSVGRKYVLKSYEYSIGKRDEAARFLERTTFGATTLEINAFVDDGNSPIDWVENQLKLPITSHRQFFRERATNWHGETTWMGGLAFRPCQRGAQYRKFVFVSKDIGRELSISTSSVDSNYKVLSVGGHVRSVIPGRVKRFISNDNKPVVPDGSYEICFIPNEFVGSRVVLRVDGSCEHAVYFDGVPGNPIIKLDEQHIGLADALVTIDDQNTVPAMAQFFDEGDTQIKEVINDIVDDDETSCSFNPTGTPEIVTIASVGSTLWIHTPSFQLQENQLDYPLIDGGKAAMVETTNAPDDRMHVRCANAPRSFLNEDHCVLSKNACSITRNNSDGMDNDSESVVVCGSPYEVANKHKIDSGTLGRGGFDLLTQYNRTLPQERLTGQRETVWLEIALKGEDQLRQRMAWALSQIIPVSPNSVDLTTQTESFLTYYDIFVRNAFGNYLDILKEVTYSPMMAEMLTYVDGASTGSTWTKSNRLHHADENYARELLQLFSVGLYKLNDDGTIQTDSNGHEIRTYTNHDISEYARVFVGFQRQPKRGNIEDVTLPEWERNEIDPLLINADLKDHFPKRGMENSYIGDGYPLCRDLPDNHFLRKGATYQVLGSNPSPELLNDPKTEWWGSDPVRLSLDDSSALASKLCNKGEYGSCTPAIKVVLESDIECSGVECTLHDIRTFEVGDGIFYEYIRPKCVNHLFYENARSIRRRWGELGHAMCGDPQTPAASTVCCDSSNSSGDNTLSRKELFSGERVSLDIAKTRCATSATTQSLCENPLVEDIDCKQNGACDNLGAFFWSSMDCVQTAKINQEGKVAIVHEPQIEDAETYKMVTSDTQMFFRVDWLSNDTSPFVGDITGNCASVGCTNGDDNICMCPITIEETLAFENDTDIGSIDMVLSTATIGSFLHTQDFEPINGISGLSKHPPDGLTAKTVFKITDNNGRTHYRKNIKSEVRLGKGAAKFRNPVSFYTLSEPTIRDAAYEIDAALEHTFFHQNTASFLALRLAQRFGESNPSPRYVKAISTAFRSGIYQHDPTNTRIGSGRYGCLEATIAAVLLDKELLDPILDKDPMHGSIQEPYLKVVKVLRALGFEATKDSPLLTVSSDLQGLIGQQSHKLPSVFSFFKSEYQPTGRVGRAGMSSPESQVLSGPTSVQMTNTIISYLKYGASSCYGGFGGVAPASCIVGDTKNNGESTYDPANYGLATPAEIIDDLATLLTSGRLSDSKRAMIKDAYEDTIAKGKSSKEATINAQQLIVTSPEFHSTSLGYTIGQKRNPPTLPVSTDLPYKAVVFVMLPGGYDSFNVLVPKTCSVTNPEGKSVRDQYVEQRGSVAFNAAEGEFDLTIDATGSNQPCSHFAIHDELTIVKDLYDAKNLSFFANAGIINNQGMTKNNYHELTRTQLFAHNAMQYETAKVDPYDKNAGTGVMGRVKDVLSKNGHVVNTISIDGPSISLEGEHVKSPPVTILGRSGSQKFAMRPDTESDFDIEQYARSLNGRSDEFSGIFGETWSQQFITGIDEAEGFQSMFNKTNLDESIWTDDGKPKYSNGDKFEQEHWEKWSTIAKTIQTKDLRNTNRDIFFTELGSWDHHNKMKDGLRSQLRALNHGLSLFVEQAKTDGFWDGITVVIASDFGRTFTPNSNDGTDHGWGGHYMILGGDVKGGQILGEYPSDLTPSGFLVDDRGRFIPTTSWDSIWNGVLQWIGVKTETDLDYCLPNRNNTVNAVLDTGRDFPLFTASSIFNEEPSSTSSSSKPARQSNVDGSRNLRGRRH